MKENIDRNGNYSVLRDLVAEHGGVYTLTMEEIRSDYHGVKRLGIKVREEIIAHLGYVGLCVIPEVLPASQDALVRVYQPHSPAGRLISTVLIPGAKADERLKEYAQVADQVPVR